MPVTYQFKLHSNGPALWPAHKGAAECQALKASTLPSAWEGTYQCNPTAPGGVTFQRSWWHAADRRFDVRDTGFANQAVARYLSFDTAMRDVSEMRQGTDPDFSAGVIAELMPDYRLAIREVWAERVGLPDLHRTIDRLGRAWNKDGKLRAILIEDRGSGTSVIQTLRQSTESQVAHLLVPFIPTTGKEVRASQAALWCSHGCILLPKPAHNAPPWVIDFEDELFLFPGGTHDDRVDAFSQLVLYVEHYLSTGFFARTGAIEAAEEPVETDDRVARALAEAAEQRAKRPAGRRRR